MKRRDAGGGVPEAVRGVGFFEGPTRAEKLGENAFEVKYAVEDGGRRYALSVLRGGDPAPLREKAAFLSRAAAAGIGTHRILACGVCDDPAYSYAVYDWIGGVGLDRALVSLPDAERRRLGLRCGALLRRVHALTRTPLTEPEGARAVETCLAEKERLLRFAGEYPAVPRFISMLEAGRLRPFSGREAAVQHGDLKPANVILTENGLALIDWVWGPRRDVTRDFVRNLVGAESGAAYAKGVIDGYFPDGPREGFWADLLRYTLLHQLELPSQRGLFGFLTPDFIRRQHALTLEQYADPGTEVPLYYREPKGDTA